MRTASCADASSLQAPLLHSPLSCPTLTPSFHEASFRLDDCPLVEVIRLRPTSKVQQRMSRRRLAVCVLAVLLAVVTLAVVYALVFRSSASHIVSEPGVVPPPTLLSPSTEADDVAYVQRSCNTTRSERHPASSFGRSDAYQQIAEDPLGPTALECGDQSRRAFVFFARSPTTRMMAFLVELAEQTRFGVHLVVDDLSQQASPHPRVHVHVISRALVVERNFTGHAIAWR